MVEPLHDAAHPASMRLCHVTMTPAVVMLSVDVRVRLMYTALSPRSSWTNRPLTIASLFGVLLGVGEVNLHLLHAG